MKVKNFLVKMAVNNAYILTIGCIAAVAGCLWLYTDNNLFIVVFGVACGLIAGRLYVKMSEMSRQG